MAPAPSIKDTEQAIQTAAKGETNVDTLVGRLVVDNGLATSDEVAHALEQARNMREEQNQASLVQVLIDNEYVTRRQMARLRQILEAERSSQQFPGFKLLGKLGAGAMASVYKARQLSLDREVAIKVLPRKFSDNPQFIERFYAEGRAAAQLNHPNIVQAYDVSHAGDYHFIVMEYVDGSTVYDRIVDNKRFAEPEAIDIIIQIAEALEHAHTKGLIHRDVKPKNIMITKQGLAKLADMGLARAVTDKEAAEAEAGKAFGTPYYISPEQIRGEKDIGPGADIYSLGATLYHMVTGNVPFDGKNPSSVMHKHLKAPLIPPDHVNPKLSPGISEVIEMMMAKTPGKRYRSTSDLLGDLRLLKDGKTPLIAHKDTFSDVDLSSVMEAEESAGGDVPRDSSSTYAGPVVRLPFVLVLAAVAGLSILANILQAVL